MATKKKVKIEDLPLPTKLDKTIKEAVKGADRTRIRGLVDYYYQMQKQRITLEGQMRAVSQSYDEAVDLEPLEGGVKSSNIITAHFYNSALQTENQLKSLLGYWTDNHPVGLWLKSLMGIGPVIAAGLLSHIDITRPDVKTAGCVVRYAGLDPTLPKPTKGVVNKYNSSLKVLCWKLGESFVKVKNKEADIYGKIYDRRKEIEIRNNEAGLFADQARAALLEKNFVNAEIKAIYESGKLPPGHIHSRCRRVMLKIFLTHLFQVLWWDYHKIPPVRPYVFDILKHSDEIPVPNFDNSTGRILVPGIEKLTPWIYDEVNN